MVYYSQISVDPSTIAIFGFSSVNFAASRGRVLKHSIVPVSFSALPESTVEHKTVARICYFDDEEHQESVVVSYMIAMVPQSLPQLLTFSFLSSAYDFGDSWLNTSISKFSVSPEFIPALINMI